MNSDRFENVNPEVFQLLKDFFYKLRKKTVGYSPARYLEETLASLEAHPLAPEKGTVVSFKFEDTNFYVIYTSDKIELSDYLTEKWEGGRETTQRFCFRIEIGGYQEISGDIEEFRLLLLNSLENMEVTKIFISEEE